MIGLLGFLPIVMAIAAIASVAISATSMGISIVQANKQKELQAKALAKQEGDAKRLNNTRLYREKQQAVKTAMAAGSQAMMHMAAAERADIKAEKLREKGARLETNRPEHFVGRPSIA